MCTLKCAIFEIDEGDFLSATVQMIVALIFYLQIQGLHFCTSQCGLSNIVDVHKGEMTYGTVVLMWLRERWNRGLM